MNSTMEKRFWSKVSLGDECWEWTGSTMPCGYGQISNRPGRPLLAHRVSWMMSHGEIADGLFVCHQCDNRKCVRPDHLFIGTNRDNVDDMMRKGRTQNRRHEENSVAFVGYETAHEIRTAALLGVRTKDIAHATGIHRNTIHAVIRGRTWVADRPWSES